MKTFKKPTIWVTISVIYIWLYSISILIATLGPPILIYKIADTDSSISFAEFENSFILYAKEGAKELNRNYDFVLYSLISNVAFIIPIALVGIFLLRKKLWAKNTMIVLLLVFILFPFILGFVTSEISINMLNVNMLFFIAIIYILTRKNIKSIFT